jgi:mycofactocin precursor
VFLAAAEAHRVLLIFGLPWGAFAGSSFVCRWPAAPAPPRRSCGSAGAGSPGPGRRWQKTRKSPRRARRRLSREAGMTQQAVTVLVPEDSAAASEKPAEPGTDGDEALVAGELLVEEVSIDGMCGVY